MIIKQINLQYFRKFASKTIELSPSTTVLLGPNASGKTSVIEGINLLATGNSFRAGKIDEMVAWSQELGRVKGEIAVGDNDKNKNSKNDGLRPPARFDARRAGEAGITDYESHNAKRTTHTDTVEIILTRGIVQGKRTSKRLYSLNDVKKRKKDVVGKFHCVVFRPEDMRLIEGSPGRRRQFVDTALCNVDRDYEWSLNTYEQALVRRNKLLIQIREGEAPKSTLHYWDQQLLKHGKVVQDKRADFLNYFRLVDFPMEFSISYSVSEINEKRMTEYESRSIAAGHTLIGPHKDDFIVKLEVGSQKPENNSHEATEPLSNDKKGFLDSTRNDNQGGFDVSVYGSRGQQRMAVLWLKMCELDFVEQQSAEKPVLLLDDILSELDEVSRAKVIGLMENYQTVVSTTDRDVVKDIGGDLQVVEFEG